jgi:hypothetical protein
MADASLTKDQERLAKLWDAYEEQEREFNLALKKINDLEKKHKETSKINTTLKKVTEGRDREIREMEIKITALEEENSGFRPELERLEALYRDEKERYAKLFAITEELEEELDTARTELELRDRWFQQYFGQLENFTLALKERAIMIRESKFTSPEKVKARKFEKVEDEPEEEEEKKVKFESLGPEDDDDSELSAVKIEGGDEGASEESAGEDEFGGLTKLELINDDLAKTLMDAGVTDVTKLAEMETIELAKIEGISPTLARKLIAAAKE